MNFFKSASTAERSGAVTMAWKWFVHDYPAVQSEAFVRLAVGEGTDENVATRRGGEDGQPMHDRRGEEVRPFGFSDAVTAAHGGQPARPRHGVASLEVRFQTEFGNEEKTIFSARINPKSSQLVTKK